MPNLNDELSTAKERRLNQFGTAVLVWCGKSVKFDRVCRTFVELNLGSTHGAPSESDVAPVSLQSRTYSVRFGINYVATSIYGMRKNIIGTLNSINRHERRLLHVCKTDRLFLNGNSSPPHLTPPLTSA